MDGPVEGVERKDTELVVVVAVSSASEQELSQLGYMLTKEGNFLVMWRISHDSLKQLAVTHENEESLEDIEELASTLLVASFDALTDHIDHRGKELLEGFLLSTDMISEYEIQAIITPRTMSSLSSPSMYFAMTPSDLRTSKLSFQSDGSSHPTYLTAVILTSRLSGSAIKPSNRRKRLCMCDSKPSTMFSRTV